MQAANDAQMAYSPENWAHQALLQMDEAQSLERWASISMPDVERYTRASSAFWEVAQLLAKERNRLEEEIRRTARESAPLERPDGA